MRSSVVKIVDSSKDLDEIFCRNGVHVFIWQKRPINLAKETYKSGKRDLFIWQKRPIHMAKEIYKYGKRDLFIWQKRPG